MVTRTHAVCLFFFVGIVVFQCFVYLNVYECNTSLNPTSEGASRLMERKELMTVNLSERFLRRRVVVESICALSKPRDIKPCEQKAVSSNIQWVKQENLLFCTVQKISSTFWLRILKVLSEAGQSKDPLSIDPRKAYGGGYTNLLKLNNTEITTIMKNSKSIIFVRDPYIRLFSGWLDKLYLTNQNYWGSFGAEIVNMRKTKIKKTQRKLQCGHDVRFPEFVDAILKKLRTKYCTDGHFAPIVSHCQPCFHNFTYIGKHETFQEDTLFILKDLNLTQKVSLVNFTAKSDMDFISDVSSFVFENRKGIEICMTLKDGFLRAWRTLQARGLLSKRSEFPFKDLTVNQSRLLNRTRFKMEILTAYRASSAEERSGNRMEVLREAYGSLSREQLDGIYSAFQRDFELYGYDRYPEFLNPTETNGFKYLEF